MRSGDISNFKLMIGLGLAFVLALNDLTLGIGVAVVVIANRVIPRGLRMLGSVFGRSIRSER